MTLTFILVLTSLDNMPVLETPGQVTTKRLRTGRTQDAELDLHTSRCFPPCSGEGELAGSQVEPQNSQNTYLF